MARPKCQCDIPNGGLCRRHNVYKQRHLVKLCQTNEKYFRLWEEKRFPTQRPRSEADVDGLHVIPGKVCPFAGIVSKLVHSRAVERLQRCREARCGMMLQHKRTGEMACVGMGKSCKWVSNWSKFLNGVDECPHWKPIRPQDTRNRQDTDDCGQGEK